MTTLPSTVTAPPPPKIADMTEEELAKSIKDKISLMLGSFKTSVERAMEIGDLLIVAKDRVGHGNFEPWVTEHCAVSYRSARRYMQMAKDREKIETQLRGKMANLANLNAAHLLTDQRENRDDGKPGEAPKPKPDPTRSPAGDYDKLEEKLIAKLKELDANEARDHAGRTIAALNETVDGIESIAKRATTKAAKQGAVVHPSQA